MADTLQFGVKRMVLVPVQVQGRAQPLDDFLFDRPRLGMYAAGDESILLHPVRKLCLAAAKGQALTAGAGL